MKNRLILVLFLLIFSKYAFAQTEIDDFLKSNNAHKGTYYTIKSALKDPDKVLKLYLSNMDYKTFPIELLKFKNVMEINLGHNSIQEIPNWLTQMVKLKVINIRNNKVKILPKFIFDLPNLKELDVWGNNINNLPANLNIEKSKLERLNLSENNLVELPQSIQKLEKLKILILENNHFKRIPKVVFEMKNLEFISFMRNDIEDFEVTNSLHSNLKGIYLVFNPINVEKVSILKKMLPNCIITTELN